MKLIVVLFACVVLITVGGFNVYVCVCA